MTDYLDDLDLTIATLWCEERITCPHRDVLRSYLAGSLPAAHMDYIRFHLEEIRCPYCSANLSDLREEGGTVCSEEEGERMRTDVRESATPERLLRSTRAYIRKVSRGPDKRV